MSGGVCLLRNKHKLVRMPPVLLLLCSSVTVTRVAGQQVMELHSGLTLTWGVHGDVVNFAAQRRDSSCGWLAIGWSESAKMIGASAVVGSQVAGVKTFAVNIKAASLGVPDSSRRLLSANFTSASSYCLLQFSERVDDVRSFATAGSDAGAINVVWAVGNTGSPTYHGSGRGAAALRLDGSTDAGVAGAGLSTGAGAGLGAGVALLMLAGLWLRKRRQGRVWSSRSGSGVGGKSGWGSNHRVRATGSHDSPGWDPPVSASSAPRRQTPPQSARGGPAALNAPAPLRRAYSLKEGMHASSDKKLFLSYGRGEASDFSRWLRDQLQAAGYQVWFDQSDIRATGNWLKAIGEALRSCDGLVAVINSKYCGSEFCKNEMTMAHSNGKPIFPILFNGFEFCHLPAEMEYPLASTQCVPFRDGSNEAELEETFNGFLSGIQERLKSPTRQALKRGESVRMAKSDRTQAQALPPATLYMKQCETEAEAEVMAEPMALDS